MTAGARLALVVATNSYEDPRFAALRAPATDAGDMAEVLGDPAIGGFEVTSLMDEPESRVRRAISGFLASPGPADLVLVYMSCHGVLDARGRLSFATRDTDRADLSATAVEAGWLLDRLEDCRARAQVVILDCCFSGAFANTKSDGDLGLDRRLVGNGRGRTVLTASRATEYSYEGEATTQPARSAFTAALVDGLRGRADRDRKGYVSVEDAYTHAAERLRELGAAQSPQRWTYGGEGDLVLARTGGTPAPRRPVARPARPLPDRCVAVIDDRLGRFDVGSYDMVAFSSDGAAVTCAGPTGEVRFWNPRESCSGRRAVPWCGNAAARHGPPAGRRPAGHRRRRRTCPVVATRIRDTRARPGHRRGRQLVEAGVQPPSHLRPRLPAGRSGVGDRWERMPRRVVGSGHRRTDPRPAGRMGPRGRVQRGRCPAGGRGP
ncbi:caspase family protein [Asanoa siamensis]|uniref:Caspase domain-containing protein n=1 Tax=Asanoa siamensis TaxID=926357 RepID=A0ABQ4CMV4_9ACTN|nr:caspase family protein [Asanoa siamensis]GIF72600.1 hypothetical protein Asi02nite_21180 [Asanoa siamensis]